MTKTQAEAYIREVVAIHAPEVVDGLMVAWIDLSKTPRMSDAKAFAFTELPHAGDSLSGEELVFVIFDQDSWSKAGAKERRELVEHEAAHVVADCRSHLASQEHHGKDWQDALRELSPGHSALKGS